MDGAQQGCNLLGPYGGVSCGRSMIRQRVRAGLNVIKDKLARDGKFVSKAGGWGGPVPSPTR